ncbi:type II toxin-antitoxin system RelE/ParE family toxin [Desulfomonile tiedjei]|uniref:Plasmid stabilization system protein n=1 Tax=Desulfomonile tiedjei (strain ATCC 49306 / DSM 6799 / DCB-1) TaxID=706587 RepID=I4CBR8_DESTA|nr:type II toxin-antitoxin system RelE/ParE family toxin [Desulfomonile tiedjei]AFM27009.1 plasmid stabilization system protein [Desulfomonile tiedjei DSM 6799]
MPRKYKITFAASAVQDLEAIRRWYANQQNPETGERFLEQVLSAVERLTDFPEIGRIVPEFGIATLREIVHPPFRIVYRLDKPRIRIVRVWRSERILNMP